MNNFEIIKRMDIDELAKFLYLFKLNKYKRSCAFCDINDVHCVYSCVKCWLQQGSKMYGGIEEEENSDE